MFDVAERDYTVKSKYSEWKTTVYNSPFGDRLIYWSDGYYRIAEDGKILDRFITDNKIRFINSKYDELFKINDGDSIRITYPDGEVLDRQCFYIDEYHTKIGSNVYHICEFAEVMERNGNRYEPMK